MQDQRADSEDDRGTEFRLLSKILAGLDNKIVVDVGADGAGSARMFVEAGAEAVYAFVAPPQDVKAPRADLVEDPAVTIVDVALGARDADECRSLASLVIDGTIPSKVGILKVDRPEDGIPILEGSGTLASAVTMIAYGAGLRSAADRFSSAPAPCDLGDMASFMEDRGYANFVVVKRHERFETLHINDPETGPGRSGRRLLFPRLRVREARADRLRRGVGRPAAPRRAGDASRARGRAPPGPGRRPPTEPDAGRRRVRRRPPEGAGGAGAGPGGVSSPQLGQRAVALGRAAAWRPLPARPRPVPGAGALP